MPRTGAPPQRGTSRCLPTDIPVALCERASAACFSASLKLDLDLDGKCLQLEAKVGIDAGVGVISLKQHRQGVRLLGFGGVPTIERPNRHYEVIWPVVTEPGTSRVPAELMGSAASHRVGWLQVQLISIQGAGSRCHVLFQFLRGFGPNVGLANHFDRRKIWKPILLAM